MSFLVLLSLVVFGVGDVVAQQTSEEPEIVAANARGCQENTKNIANMGALAGTTKEKVFVIAHLGSGETAHGLNRRRLNDIKSEFGDNFRSGKILLTEGERVKGAGRVEFYRGSELYWISFMAHNGDFCSLCCDRRRLFYKNDFRTHKRQKRR